MSSADISRRLGNVSERAVRYRINRLIATGIIEVKAIVNPRALGLAVNADVWLEVEPSLVREVAESMAGFEQVSYVAFSTGRTRPEHPGLRARQRGTAPVRHRGREPGAGGPPREHDGGPEDRQRRLQLAHPRGLLLQRRRWRRLPDVGSSESRRTAAAGPRQPARLEGQTTRDRGNGMTPDTTEFSARARAITEREIARYAEMTQGSQRQTAKRQEGPAPGRGQQLPVLRSAPGGHGQRAQGSQHVGRRRQRVHRLQHGVRLAAGRPLAPPAWSRRSSGR